ncbi:MAG TPA: nickel-dependent lactate racemase [Capillibacterium sp.]
MPVFKLPYHTTHMEVEVEEKNLKAVLTSNLHQYRAKKGEQELILEALANPIGTPRLRELARGKKKVVIVTSDHTRAMPSKLTLPVLLAEIRQGNPEAQIKILIATGLHRATTVEEQRQKFGDKIVEEEEIVVHNAFDENACEYVCQLPSGASLVVNKLVTEADLLVCEGFIEPHFFAGFSGGAKSILPGVCSAKTVNENHSARAIAHPNSKAGIIHGNVIHEDMVYAARQVGVDFILNVTLDAEKKVIAAFAGDVEKAHEAGCNFVTELSRVEPVQGDIVITSVGGYPLDQNLYQSPKAAATAEACAGEDGVIILVAGCVDGLGGEHFGELITGGTVEEIHERIMGIPDEETIPEQWCAQIFSSMLMKHKLILVTTNLAPGIVRKANMIPAASAQEALALAYQLKGADAKVVVIPDGVSVIAV